MNFAPFEKLIHIFLIWNKKLNLSAFRTEKEIMIKHVIDSLLIAPFANIKAGNVVMDLGTGGGFPGLPLAIVFSKTHFFLVDSVEKKLEAVKAMAKEIGLHNTTCVLGRAEELGRGKRYRENIDLVVARALGQFPTILEYALPFVKVNGRFIAYQGPEILKNLQSYHPVIRQLSGQIEDVRETSLPENQGTRVFVVIKKIAKISDFYPRAPGIPKKNPLA